MAERTPQEKEIIDALGRRKRITEAQCDIVVAPDPRKQYVIGIDPSDGEELMVVLLTYGNLTRHRLEGAGR